MNTKERLASRLLRNFDERRELENRLARLEEMGEDIYEDGEVLSFDKRFVAYGRTYTYVVVKANGKWYTSGPQGGGTARTWEDLVEFWAEGVDHIFRCVKWEPVV